MRRPFAIARSTPRRQSESASAVTRTAAKALGLALVVSFVGSSGLPSTSSSAEAAVVTREARLWPFASDSPWNTPIGSDASFESVTSPATATLLDRSISTNMNAGQWSHPIYSARVGDPVVTVVPRYVPSYSGWIGWVDAPAGHRASYAIPAAAKPAAPDQPVPMSDRHMHVVDPSGRWVNEAWALEPDGSSTWRAGTHATVDLLGSGLRGGTRAYGGSAIAGLIRTWEVEQGAINHAIAVALHPAQLKTGQVWPAVLQDGDASTSYSGLIPMGSLLAIPRSTDLSTLPLTPDGLVLARALQTFGAYVTDRASNVALYAEPALETSPRTANMRRDLALLRSHLRIVTNNGPTSVGGPGQRTGPVAPPVGTAATGADAPATSTTISPTPTTAAPPVTTTTTTAAPKSSTKSSTKKVNRRGR